MSWFLREGREEPEDAPSPEPAFPEAARRRALPERGEMDLVEVAKVMVTADVDGSGLVARAGVAIGFELAAAAARAQGFDAFALELEHAAAELQTSAPGDARSLIANLGIGSGKGGAAELEQRPICSNCGCLPCLCNPARFAEEVGWPTLIKMHKLGSLRPFLAPRCTCGSETPEPDMDKLVWRCASCGAPWPRE